MVITDHPGGLLHRRFTLTNRTRGAAGGHFLWPYPRVASPGSYPAPCYVERGLSLSSPEGKMRSPGQLTVAINSTLLFVSGGSDRLLTPLNHRLC